jgi:septum formation protein
LFLKSEQPLILASTSAYRRELLGRLGLSFGVQAPDVDESPVPGEHPRALAARLALAKARTVSLRAPQAWVIGSDQIAVRDDAILGKPLRRERCIEQLSASSGRRVQFLTAVALVQSEPRREFQFVDTTWVSFRTLDASSIARYVEREQPFDCAGGFKCEGLGISLFDSIETVDPTALIGLPLIALSRLLREAGYQVP